jgi:glutaconyl-CoA/methylmalonyl-CoA decarboxylase subunit gamma
MRRYNIKVGPNEYVIDVQEMAADLFRVWIEDRELDVVIAGEQDIAEATITPEIAPVRTDAESIERPNTIYRPPAPETLPPLPVSHQPALPHVSAGNGELDLAAPMPGTILAINVVPGDQVRRGQVLLILEAMKMKNSIKSPYDGVIAEVLAQSGQAVSYGSVLLRYESGNQ